MKTMFPLGMLEAAIEATRLTREGRVLEATALIQRTLGGAAAPEADPAQRPASNEAAPASRIIDVDPETGDAVPFATRSADARSEAQVAGSAARTGLRQALRGLFRPARLRDRAPAADGLTRAPLVRKPGPISPEPITGARFLAGSFSGQAGSLRYKLYVPSVYRGELMPLLVMLHGCTQSADDFAAGTRMNHLAEEQGLLVLYPEQSRSANAQKCWNWFRPEDQQRDSGEPGRGLSRPVRRCRCAFRSGARGGQRHALCLCRHAAWRTHAAARRRPPRRTLARRSDHRVPCGPRQHGASAQQRPGHRAGRDGRWIADGGAARTSARRACLHPHAASRRRWPGLAGAVADPWRRACLGGRQCRRVLHRPARP